MIAKLRFAKQCDYFLAMSYEHPEGKGEDLARVVVEAWEQRGLDIRKLALGVRGLCYETARQHVSVDHLVH